MRTSPMAEMKVCKCRCGAELVSRYEGAYEHPVVHATGQKPKCFMSGVMVPKHERERWNALMDDTRVLRAIEVTLEKAAVTARHACLVQPDGGEPTDDERMVCEEAEHRIRAIDKNAILQEISHE